MAEVESSNKKFQIDALDGLRGFAALIVIFSHTSNVGMHYLPFLDLQGIGKSGVFLFFLLSSFLLSTQLLGRGQEMISRPVLWQYFQRRFFRIYPLYTLYLLLGVVSTYLISTLLEIPDEGIPFTLNWSEFFAHMALLEGKGVTWSIAVEFKFYFVLPLLSLLVFWVSTRFSFAATFFFLLALIAFSQLLSPQSESLTNDARLMPYMSIFLAGILLAVVQIKLNSLSRDAVVFKVLKALGYLGLFGLTMMIPSVYSLLVENVEKSHFGKQFILHTFFWSLVLLAAINTESYIKRFFTWPALRFYGALSFSIYLFHPVFIGAVNLLNVNGVVGAWLVLLLATVSSYISFKVLEEPVSKYRIMAG